MDLINRFLVVEIVGAFTTIYLAYANLSSLTTSCVGFQFLGIRLMLIGVAFVILSAISCATSESNEYVMMVKTLYFSMPLLVVLLVLGIFVVSVSVPGRGRPVPGKSDVKYEVESYSKWMQNKVHANWDTYYKQAIVKNKEFVCAQFDHESNYQIRVDPAFEFGCCDAPRECEMCSLSNHTSSQGGTKLENGDDYCNYDCKRWDNDSNTLCFDCESCKAGFLQDVTKKWLVTGIQFVFFGVILLGVLITAIRY